jgi:hypothetical protein
MRSEGTDMAPPINRTMTAAERRTFDACILALRREAEAMIEGRPHIIAAGDLEGDIIHAAAHIVAAFTRRTHSKLDPSEET